MKYIDFYAQFSSIQSIIDSLLNDSGAASGINGEAHDKKIYTAGRYIDATLAGDWDDPSVEGYLPDVLYEWLQAGFVADDFDLEGYESWAPAQLMGAWAFYLLEDARRVLVDISPSHAGHNINGWTREDTTNHCATSLIFALEACHFGRLLLGVNITDNPIRLAEIHQQIREKIARAGGLGKTKNDKDGKQAAKTFVKECWQAWQKSPNKYKSKEAFARDMLEKNPGILESTKVITDWCRLWKKSEPL